LIIQLEWMYDQITQHPDDEYWHQVSLALIQLNGLIDGYYNVHRGPRMMIDNVLDLLLFQIQTSVGDLGKLLGMPNIEKHDSCSALIKLLPNNEDLYVSHADWSNYKTMLKILKRYIMPLKRTPTGVLIPGREIAFSSYPGTLHSVDDFYMTQPAGLTVIETTIENYNDDLWRNLIPLSVPEWIRVIVANRLSKGGEDWVNTFFNNNDGTYSNQWMIVNYNQFKPHSPPREGTLIVAEQMITDFEWQDMTDTLIRDTYWASYNNVFFPRLRTLSKEEGMGMEFPQLFSWNASSRAQIFHRDQGNVTDMHSMIRMMRYNDFKNDPLSECATCTPNHYSSELTIAARCDLNDPNGKYPYDVLGHRVHGATDAKITNYTMFQNLSLIAIAGPTWQGQDPFNWSTSDFAATVPHHGHPDSFKFHPFTPTWLL